MSSEVVLMSFWNQLDTALNIIGYTVLGYWVLRFIYYAYIKGYKVKEPSHYRSNFWDYM
jgi:hypothetical protein